MRIENGVRVINEGPVKNIRMGFYRSLVEQILARFRKKNAELSLAFVGDPTIRRLNRRYRGQDRFTDVLTFDLSRTPPPPGRSRRAKTSKTGRSKVRFPLVAEIVISTETARRQAVEKGHSLHRELSILVIHGLLHALGYDHEDPRDAARMKRRERVIARGFLEPALKPSRKKGGD